MAKEDRDGRLVERGIAKTCFSKAGRPDSTAERFSAQNVPESEG